MSEFVISVRTNVKDVSKQLDYLAFKELPFAVALAVNSMGKKIIEMERANFKNTFDRPTPFTMSALGMIPAVKNRPIAVVFVKDIQAQYLMPYEFGGKAIPAKPGNRAMLNPKGITVNQYGNIPYMKVRTLLGLDLNDPKKRSKMSPARVKTLQKNQKMYFIGKVQRGGQSINGLWKRLPGHKGLKLMFKFTDPVTVKQHLDYHARAAAIVDKNFDRILLLSVKYAMDTPQGV